MKVYVISDTHFYHTNIIKYCNRPYATVEDMNSDIIQKWNSIIKPGDMVIHLGDVGLGSKDKIGAIIAKLNGKKMLIKGNHDNFTDQAYKDMGFSYVFKFPIVYNGYILSHAPLECDCGDLINIYGHVHNDGRYKDTRHAKCVSVERINYTPVLLYDTDNGKKFL